MHHQAGRRSYLVCQARLRLELGYQRSLPSYLPDLCRGRTTPKHEGGRAGAAEAFSPLQRAESPTMGHLAGRGSLDLGGSVSRMVMARKLMQLLGAIAAWIYVIAWFAWNLTMPYLCGPIIAYLMVKYLI